MNGPDTSEDRPLPVGGSTAPLRFPWGGLILAMLSFAALAFFTVGGAVRSNRIAGEHLRRAAMREVDIASTHGLDLLAVRRGRTEYLATCIACHGPRGEALPNLGKDIASSEFVADAGDSELLMFLKLGRSTWDPANTTGVAMPPKGGNPMIDDDDLFDIMQFMRFLQADVSSTGSES